MVYRFSWIAGLAAISFAFWELTKLLRPSVGTTHWQFIVLAGLALGIVITWTALSYRLSAALLAVLNLMALFLASARYAAPDDSFLVFPTRESLSVLWFELERAFQLIQTGIEPVLPVPGLVIIVTAVFWGLGAVLTWGLMRGHPFVALVPPIVVALQFATVDRRPTSLLRVAVFVLLVAGSILAVTIDERDQGAGRMARRGDVTFAAGRPSPTAAVLVSFIVLGAVFSVGALRTVVPRDGLLAWRNATGLTGSYFGSISYNPFTSIQRGLVAQTETPVFVATVTGDVAPTDVRFRLLTLESYSGGQWFAESPMVRPITERPWEVESQAYAGPTARVDTAVEILALAMDWLPAPYAPVDASSPDVSVEAALRVRSDDASIRYDGGRSYQGMQYAVSAAVPRIDSAVLATGRNGELSPLFATAQGEGESVPSPSAEIETRELEDEDRFLDLPEDIDPQIETEARAVTTNLQTPFEKGLALETWFRRSGGFVYDVRVTPGHEADTLAGWLFDEDNPDRRRGYCEQFATAMAVMARTLDIPSRVVLGFTPGERIGPNQVVVKDKNAHAWVELWMPTQGWVAFDPTPRSDGANPETAYGALEERLGFDVTEYLAQVPAPPPVDFNTGGGIRPDFAEDGPEVVFRGTGGADGSGATVPGWLVWAGVIVGVAGLLFAGMPLLKWLRHRRRMRRFESGDISAAWEDIVARLTDLGEAPSPSSTPVEVARSVDEAMRPLAAVYSRSIYGEGPLREDDVAVAGKSLQRTTETLTTRYSQTQRLIASYRLDSLLSGRRRRRRRRS